MSASVSIFSICKKCESELTESHRVCLTCGHYNGERELVGTRFKTPDPISRQHAEAMEKLKHETTEQHIVRTSTLKEEVKNALIKLDKKEIGYLLRDAHLLSSLAIRHFDDDTLASIAKMGEQIGAHASVIKEYLKLRNN